MAEYSIVSWDKLINEKSCEEQYTKLKKSKEILFDVRTRENIYHIILLNYDEFEKELLKIQEDEENDPSDINGYLIRKEQRILNLFSSITRYLDSFRKKEGIKKYSEYLKKELKKINKYIWKVSDKDQKLKIMRHLRNHIQHNGILVEKGSIGTIFEFHINKNNIKADDFDVNDFKDIEEDIDLKKYLRQYIDFISDVHQQFRQETDTKVKEARNCLENILKVYPKFKCLEMLKKEDNVVVEQIPILLDWDDARVALVEKNRVPTFFTKQTE